MRILEKESQIINNQLTVDFVFERQGNHGLINHKEHIEARVADILARLNPETNLKALASGNGQVPFAGAKRIADNTSEAIDEGLELRCYIDKKLGLNRFASLQNLSEEIKGILSQKGGDKYELMYRLSNIIKKTESSIRLERDKVISDLNEKESAYKKLFGNPVRIQVESPRLGEFEWNPTAKRNQGEGTKGADLYGKWLDILTREVNNWVKNKKENPLAGSREVIAEAVKINGEDLKVGEFYKAMNVCRAVESTMDMANSSSSFFLVNSRTGENLARVVAKMNERRKVVMKKIKMMSKIIQDFDFSSLEFIHDVFLEEFIKTETVELCKMFFNRKMSSDNIPNLGHIDYGQLKIINKAKSITSVKAAEIYLSKQVPDSVFHKESHSIIQKYNHLFENLKSKSTHCVWGITLPGEQVWEITPLLSRFCDSKKIKSFSFPVMMEVDLEESEQRVICNIDLEVNMVAVRDFMKKRHKIS